MKKTILILISLMMILTLLSSCDSGKTGNSGGETGESSGKSNVLADETEKIYDKQIDFNESAMLGEQTVIDESGILVQFTAFDYNVNSEKLGPILNFYMKNDRSEDIFVRIYNMTVNGIMNKANTNRVVRAGKDADEPLYLMLDDMVTFGTDTISTVTFDMIISNSKQRLMQKKNITYQTNITDYKQNYDVDGDVLIDNEYLTIKLVARSNDDYSTYCDYVFFNKTDKDLRVTSYNVRVNDTHVYSTLDVGIKAGTYAFNYMTLDNEDLSDAGIDEINDIKMMFDIYEYDSFDESGLVENVPIATTDEIVIVNE